MGYAFVLRNDVKMDDMNSLPLSETNEVGNPFLANICVSRGMTIADVAFLKGIWLLASEWPCLYTSKGI